MKIFYLVVDLGDGDAGVFFFDQESTRDLFLDLAERAGDHVSDDGSFVADDVLGLHFYSEADILDKYGDYED